MDLPTEIRYWRERAGFSQHGLSLRLGDPHLLHAWESGQHRPSRPLLARFCTLCRVPPGYAPWLTARGWVPQPATACRVCGTADGRRRRGRCAACYHWWWRHGQQAERPPYLCWPAQYRTTVCAGCGRATSYQHTRRQLCTACYMRAWRRRRALEATG